MAKRRTCPACNRSFIAGERVWFASRIGLRPALVCRACARRGVTVVQDRSADLTRCIECEKNAAVLCLLCHGRKARELKS